MLLDSELMEFLATSSVPDDRDARQRMIQAGGFVKMWSDGSIYVEDACTPGAGRLVPPLYERAAIVMETLKLLAYPSG